MNLPLLISEDLLKVFEQDETRTYEGYVGELPDGWYFQADISVCPVWDVKECRSLDEVSQSTYSHTLWYVENLKLYQGEKFVRELTDDEHNRLIKYLQS